MLLKVPFKICTYLNGNISGLQQIIQHLCYYTCPHGLDEGWYTAVHVFVVHVDK